MYLAGLRIPDEDVRELIKVVDEPTRSFLERSLGLEAGVVALTVEDRERILWALDDARTDSLGRAPWHLARGAGMAPARRARSTERLVVSLLALARFSAPSAPVRGSGVTSRCLGRSFTG